MSSMQQIHSQPLIVACETLPSIPMKSFKTIPQHVELALLFGTEESKNVSYLAQIPLPFAHLH